MTQAMLTSRMRTIGEMATMIEQREPPQEPLSAERIEEIRESMHGVVRSLTAGCDAAVLDLLAEVDRLRAENVRLRAALAAALPFLRELAGAHLSLVDEDDVLIKVRPGRAAWLLSRARVLLASTEAAEPASGGPAGGGSGGGG